MAAQPPDEPSATESGAGRDPGDEPPPHDGSADVDDLAARLEEVQRRTEELAARVADFRQETARLAAQQEGTPDGAEPEESGEAAEHGDSADSAEGADRPRRRHRPRPSPNAPLVYDDGPGNEDDTDDTEKPDPAPDPAKPDPAETPGPARKPDPAGPAAAGQADDGSERKRRRPGIPRWLRRLRTPVIVLVVLAAVVLALRTWVAEPFTVGTATMQPTLKNGDHLLVQKLSYDFHDPQRGDLVLFDRPSGWHVPYGELVGRVIGVPGDRIVIRDHRVRVNGALLDESYLNKSCHGTDAERLGHDFRVRKGSLFVMGDNRCHSRDSRSFGAVPTGNVIGKALLVFWPVSRFGSP